MTIPNRTVSIKSVFASTANTTIPTPPAPGVSYRNTGTTAAEIGEGWPFKEVVDSAKFNQAMYEYTTICQQLEKYGFLPWSANTDYPAQGCALGSDGKIYQAKQATGPSSTSKDPTTDTSHTYWDLFYYADVTAGRALVSNANGKMAASSVTSTELSYLSGVTSGLQTQINNKAANNAVVHLTGNETITGEKTFSSKLEVQGGLIGKAILTSNSGAQLRLIDPDGSYGMLFRNDGTGTYIFPTSQNDPYGTWRDANIGIRIDNTSGIVYLRGEYGTSRPAITDVGKGSHFVKFSNGLMIQWGNSEYGGIINYPQPFVNDDVVVTATIKAANGTNDNDAITFINNVGFNFYNYSGGGCLWTAFGHWY